MTTEQKITRQRFEDEWKRAGVHLKAKDFSFEIQVYETPLEMYWHRFNTPYPYTFPTVRAAQHFLTMYHPDVAFYDLVLVYQKANCPAPFILE